MSGYVGDVLHEKVLFGVNVRCLCHRTGYKVPRTIKRANSKVFAKLHTSSHIRYRTPMQGQLEVVSLRLKAVTSRGFSIELISIIHSQQ